MRNWDCWKSPLPQTDTYSQNIHIQMFILNRCDSAIKYYSNLNINLFVFQCNDIIYIYKNISTVTQVCIFSALCLCFILSVHALYFINAFPPVFPQRALYLCHTHTNTKTHCVLDFHTLDLLLPLKRIAGTPQWLYIFLHWKSALLKKLVWINTEAAWIKSQQ